jgi:bile acid-coenzyme A ligase
MDLTPFATALRRLVEQDPDAPAITDAAGTITRAQLDSDSNRLARAFQDSGVSQDDVVSICLPSDRRFLVAAWAAWKLGATPQPLSTRIAPAELGEVVALTKPALLVGPDLAGSGVPTWDPDTDVSSYDDGPLPVAVASSWKAPTSGGSTGRPKVILSTTPALVEPLVGLGSVLRVKTDDVYLAPAPLHHNGPFLSSSVALLMGAHVVLMERFDPVRALELVERHRVGWMYAVPTIMSRIAKLPADVVQRFDVSSLHTAFHMAAPCPDWLKRWWIDWLGPDAIWELYAGTEVQAITVINGSEWLEHPGSVGRTIVGEVVVLREDGSPADPGEVGEVWMKVDPGAPTYRYLGGEAKGRDGWESLGDLGSMDAEGYLYLADRLTDMVLVGGVNVYPAEVEAALDAHPLVASSCVIGLPDDDLGNALHAVVQTSGDVTDDELHSFLADRLAPYKRPRTFERVDTPLRDEAGKVRRSALRAERLARAGG